MDPECVAICEAINRRPDASVRPAGSWCGRGEKPFRVGLLIDSDYVEGLPHVLYWADACHSGMKG